MYRFLTYIDPTLADMYLDEKIQQEGVGQRRQRKTIDVVEAEEKRERLKNSKTIPLFKPKPKTEDPVFATMARVSDLEENHFCRQYVANRQIPTKFWDVLFYTSNYKSTAIALQPEEIEATERLPEDARLVIPFYNTKGEVVAIQGRALDPEAFVRYITIKKTVKTEKIFGLERLDVKKPRLVVEGPIDSLFLPNCVATADADLIKYEKGDVYIPDNQYRNPQICDRIKKIIDAGKKVVLFPPEAEGKDINDMVKEHGTKYVLDLIKNNIFQGIMAEVRFAELNKSPKRRRSFSGRS